MSDTETVSLATAERRVRAASQDGNPKSGPTLRVFLAEFDRLRARVAELESATSSDKDIACRESEIDG